MRILYLYISVTHLSHYTDYHPFPALWNLLYPTISWMYSFPAWSTTTWFGATAHSSGMVLVFRLMEGGWWTTFKWLYASLFGLYFAFLSLMTSKPHQSYRQDIRLYFPSIELHPPGCCRYTNSSWHRRTKYASTFGHHQYGIRLRLRSTFLTIQYGTPVNLPRPYVCTRIRNILLRLNRPPKVAPLATTPVVCSRFDAHLYDSVLARLESRLFRNVKVNVESYFDAQLFDRTPLLAKTRPKSTSVVPDVVLTRFDTILYDKWLSRHLLPHAIPSTQDKLRFETYYQMSKSDAWSIFNDYIHPYDWIQREHALHGPSFLSTTANPDATLYQARNYAVALQQKLNPTLQHIQQLKGLSVMLARTSPPKLDQMHGAFLTGNRACPRIPVVLDTGASIAVSPCRNDFVSPIEKLDLELNGLDHSIKVVGTGWVEWHIRDYFGRVGLIRTKAYYVPSSHVRLFSPQSYFKEHKGNPSSKGKCEFDHSMLHLTTVKGQEMSFPFDSNNHLPYMLVDNNALTGSCSSQFQANLMSDHPSLDTAQNILLGNNYNLSKSQKELLLWHQRLGHAGQGWIQDLMRKQKKEVGETAESPLIPNHDPAATGCKHARCAACLLARQHRKSAGSSFTTNKPEKNMAIRANDLVPGQRVSTDQYVCAKPGRLPHTHGKEPPASQYNGGTLFYDHASALIFHQHQVSLGNGETIKGKHKFERFARSHGVQVKSYLADNQPFGSKAFVEDIETQNQKIDFSGVGAHHQNGVAERALQTVTSWARAMMLHQLLHWPDQYDSSLWPFAMDHATYLWNNLPRARGEHSPLELFSGTKQPAEDTISRSRVWGCPAYVLDPRLQDQKKLPKWTKRSRCGMYLGASLDHHSTVGKILNLKTGAVSPQFHVVYDELYTTTFGHLTETAFDVNLWAKMLELNSVAGSPFERESPVPVSSKKQSAVDRAACDLFKCFTEPTHVTPPPLPVPEGEDTNFAPDACGTSVSEGATSSSEGDPRPKLSKRVRFSDELDRRRPRTRSHTATRRSRRSRKANPKYAATCMDYSPTLQHNGQPEFRRQQYLAGGNSYSKSLDRSHDNARLHALDWNPLALLSSVNSIGAKSILHDLIQGIPTGEWNPMALQAKSKSPDTPGWAEAMNGPYAEGYKEAAKKEVDTLIGMRVWDEVDREPWMNVLPSTWAFRRKTFPDGTTKKLKGRFCVRGDRQIPGVHYDPDQIYAPVVSWTTVRLLLLLSAQLDLATRQVDYVAAFVHAPMPVPKGFNTMSKDEQARSKTYVEMPRGFCKEGKVLRLNKALYGLSEAPVSFFRYLKGNLEAIGFQQAIDVDPCLFISDKVICLVYVDDTLLYAKNDADIDEVVRQLQDERQMALEIEDDVAGFLGVDIKKDSDTGCVILKQDGLKKRIVEALKIEDLPDEPIPATSCLGKDLDGEPPNCDFNYASVVGMCFYLYSHSCPEIGFAISQLARFSFNPRRSHELALIQLGQYLKGTIGQGMVLKPMKLDEFCMDVYVDSDFMGIYGKEERNDPDNVRSRTGYVILLNDCPVVWKSCLQEAITTSTMMAEYYSLSAAMKEVLPLRSLVARVAEGFKLDSLCKSTFKCTAHEDNASCQTLANLEPGRQTPRSKWYDNRVHWFRSMLNDDIVVTRVESKLQIADIYTKPLGKDDFIRLREMLVGW